MGGKKQQQQVVARKADSAAVAVVKAELNAIAVGCTVRVPITNIVEGVEKKQYFKLDTGGAQATKFCADYTKASMAGFGMLNSAYKRTIASASAAGCNEQQQVIMANGVTRHLAKVVGEQLMTSAETVCASGGKGGLNKKESFQIVD